MRRNYGETVEVYDGLGIDSGQIIICDPCYLSSWKEPVDDKVDILHGTDSYAETARITLSERGHGEVRSIGAYAVGDFGGDVPVRISIVRQRRKPYNGQIARVVIDFHPFGLPEEAQ